MYNGLLLFVLNGVITYVISLSNRSVQALARMKIYILLRNWDNYKNKSD